MRAVVLPDKDLLARLVGFDSTSANSNLPIADFICEYLDRPQVTITRQPSPDGTKTNVIAVAGPDGGGEGLTFSGHMDVVPAGEPEWRSDPFTLTETDGTYVGRGACDMKASIALAMNVFAAADPTPLRKPLALLLTYDEELGTLGAQHFVASWPGDRVLPRNVVVGEPTSLRSVRLHKGHLTMRVTVTGKAAHSGSPHLGTNAIESGARIVKSLANLAGLFKQKRCDTSGLFPAVPYPVLNVSRISGGTAINVVPDRCVVELGIRELPGMNTEATVAWVRDTVLKSEPHGNVTVEVCNNSPPMLLDDRAEINRAVSDLVHQRQSVGVSFASDAGPLAARGFECVLFGPGSIEVAHRPNEFVPIEEFTRARAYYERLVQRFCS